MSGFKYSTADIKKERQEAIDLLNEVREARAKLRALRTRIKGTLDRTPRGIKEMFQEEIARALDWLDSSRQDELDELERSEYAYPRYGWREGSIGTELALATYGDMENLRKAFERLTVIVDKGFAVQSALIISFTQKADAAEQAAVLRLVHLESLYEGSKELLASWFPPQTTREFEAALKEVSFHLSEHRIQEGGTRLEAIESSINARIKEARDLERKHQKRLYVLKALRQVCCEMGFQESEPRYEGDSHSKKSNVVYEVDTLDQGKVVFFLSLDRINSHSAIAEDRCIEEFEAISRNLESDFGIKTKFGGEVEKPDDRLLHKGELDLPEGAHMARTL